MSQKDAVEYSATVSAEEAAGYLEMLANSLRVGVALIESGETSLTLEVGPTVQIEIEAASNAEKGKSSIDISVSWRAAEQAKPQPSLLIIAGSAASEPVEAE